MRMLKKLLFVGFLTSILVLSLSLSASAAAIEGIVDERGVVQFPMDYVSDSSLQYYGIIIKNSSNKYYLFSFGLPSDLANGTSVTFSLQKRNSNNLDFLIPHLYKEGIVTSGYMYTVHVPIHFLGNGNNYNVSQMVFDKSSSPLNTYVPLYVRQPLANYGTIVDYQIVYFPGSNIKFNSLNVTDIENGGNYPYTALPIIHEGFYYEFADGYTNFTGTDLDKLITSDGTLTPIYDDNGNIINYNIHNEYNFGYNEDITLPTREDVTNEFELPTNTVDAFANTVQQNNNAIEWIYEKVNDLTSNQKIRAISISIMSMFVIALIINKQWGV